MKSDMRQPIHPILSASILNITQRIDAAAGWLASHTHHKTAWPAIPGAYQVGDAQGCVAICSVSGGLNIAQAALIPGVAIAGRVYTANLGIEKMILNLLRNPRIRFLILCGKESPFFQVGQALRCLSANGTDADRHICGAKGHYPQVKGLTGAQIQQFQEQIELIDRTGETTPDTLAGTAQSLRQRNPGPYTAQPARWNDAAPDPDAGFTPLKLGAKRDPLALDPHGFFIIAVDQGMGEIVVRHYHANHQPAHVIRGRSGEAILLSLLRDQLVSQMSHAGYLGAELTKAETALRLKLTYEQDQPLRNH